MRRRSISHRLISSLISSFPSPFRERFGAEMLSAYLDQREEIVARVSGGFFATRWPVLQHDLRTSAGLFRALIAERDELRRRQRVLNNHVQRDGYPAMQLLLSDLRHATRRLASQPGFALIAILTLALGIGANTAVFSVLNSVVLSPLPYRNPDQLVRLYTASAAMPDDKGYHNGLDLLDARDQVQAFASVGVMMSYREVGRDLIAADGHPERVRVLPVSADYFTTLGATPLLGRTFTREEERSDVKRIILSHALWTEFAARDSGVVGRAIDLSGERYEVIGVMRETFSDVVGANVAGWIPQNLQRGGENSRGNYYLSAVARLRPGVTPSRAQEEVNAFTKRLDSDFPLGRDKRRMRVVALHDDIVGQSRSAIFILMGAAGLVLLIACLNVANLFLARSVTQSRETSIRTALGAARHRIVTERLVESLVVAAAGGVVGSLTAYWGIKGLLYVSPDSLTRAEEVSFDPRLFGFAIVLTMFTTLLFGAGPAWCTSRADPNDALHEASRGNTVGRSRRNVRSVLVAGQVSVALVLLVGAGLLLSAFIAQMRRNLGFNPSAASTFEINLPVARYDSANARVRFHAALNERIRALPGVQNVGATSWLPANGSYHLWGYEYLDQNGERQNVLAQVRVVTGDILGSLGVPLLAGRAFGVQDVAGAPGAGMISASLARKVYGTRNPLGERFRTGDSSFTVVGVVSDVVNDIGRTSDETIYIPHEQFAGDRNWTLTYVVRSTLPPDQLIARARSALGALDPAVVLYHPRTMEGVIAKQQARDRFVVVLMIAFGAVALMLAAVGVFGVLSYLVTQRGHEIGVRLALGARPAQVRTIVMREAGAVAGVGAIVGLLASVALGRVLASFATSVRPFDLPVFGGASLVLGIAVLLASYIPAKRATRVSPLEALRQD